MIAWCEGNWGKVPAESMIRDHIVKAVEKFAKAEKADNLVLGLFGLIG